MKTERQTKEVVQLRQRKEGRNREVKLEWEREEGGVDIETNVFLQYLPR